MSRKAPSPRVVYELTTLGHDLLGIVAALVGWAAEHHAEIDRNRSALS